MRVSKSFDHVVMVSDDLERDGEIFRMAGFSVTRRDDPPGGLTQNLLICLSDGSYIELFVFLDTSYRASHRWRDAAPGIWADYSLATDSLSENCAMLQHAGIIVPEPNVFRKTLADGTPWACRTVHLGRNKGPSVLPFLVEDLTPRHLRAPMERIRHDNGATAIVGCTLVVEDLTAARALLASLRPDHIEAGSVTTRLRFGDRWIELIQPRMQEADMMRHLREHGEGVWSVTLASDLGAHVFSVGKAQIRMIPHSRSASNVS